MEKLTEVLAMGGYGAFVWPSYGIAALVLISLFYISRRNLTRMQDRLRRVEAAKNHET
ncbi:MAG: heme exporter protein CcmD [Rickettsiales bacterium]|jgi:heme exporter protein D|nr:heme exporter protein CcmD [Rickettsiales bacterium]